jgi:quinoprotein glucose dehydrogenase
MRRSNKAAIITTTLLLAFTVTHTQAQKPTSGMREWPFYGGDQGGAKYSPLIHINRNNVRKLQVAWQWKTGEKRLQLPRAADADQ